MVLPVSGRCPRRQYGRLQAERQPRRHGCQGVLSKSDQEPEACPADNHAGRLCRIASTGARAESRWLAADGHEAALVEMSKQPDCCLLYTSDAADDLLCVDLGGRRIIKKK